MSIPVTLNTFPNRINIDDFEEVSLEVFYKFLQSRHKLVSKGLTLEPVDSQAYYKLRHNLFKTHVTYLLDLPNKKEESFFDVVGISSNRTPDILLFNGVNELEVIEFSVSNKYSTFEFTKEGGAKYDEEIFECKSKGIDVDEYYFLLALDEDVDEVVDNIIRYQSKKGLESFEDPFEVLNDLRLTLLEIQWYVNEIMPDLLSQNVETLKFNRKGLIVPTPFPIILKQRMRSKNYKSMLFKKIKGKFKSILKNLRRKPSNLKFKLIYNYANDNLYLRFDEFGLDKTFLMDLLISENNLITDHIKVEAIYADLDQPFSKFGDVEPDSLTGRVVDYSYNIDDLNYQGQLYHRLTNDKIKLDTLKDHQICNEVETALLAYNNKLTELRAHEKSIKIRKCPFIFIPTFNLTKTQDVSYTFFSKFNITDRILKYFNNNYKEMKDYKIDRKIDESSFLKTEKELTNIGKKLKYLNLKTKDFSRLSDVIIKEKFTPNEQEVIFEYKNLIKKFSNTINEAKRTTYKNRLNIPMSIFKREFYKEMEHFNKDHSRIELFPEEDINIVHGLFKNILEEQFLKRAEVTSDSTILETESIGFNLAKTCEQMKDTIKQIDLEFRSTELASSILFNSQFCYSLLYYSNIKLNKNDFCYDKLGYKNAALIVRGGAKTISTRRSRLFKLIIPISETIAKIIGSTSFETFKDKGQLFLITPWRQLRQDYLKKGIESYYNIFSLYSYERLDCSLDMRETLQFMSLKLLNYFSQKRKVEVWFSSLRYIYLNSSGTNTSLVELLSSMPIFDTDPYIYLIQRLFTKNLEKVIHLAGEKKLLDIFWGIVNKNFDLCADRFEENILMTKSPFDPMNEHLNNLRSVLETHKYFIEEVGEIEPKKILEATDIKLGSERSIDKNDFMFDSKTCYLIGKMAADNISVNSTRQELDLKFSEILGKTFTEVKTSRGMRSDDDTFWGKKGFDVVFEKLNLASKVSDIVNNLPNTRRELTKILKNNHISYHDRIHQILDSDLLFDMKDKMQYKGSREIYVMSENTKIQQQPLEQFFKELCKYWPNEMINKKSHVRPKMIHSKVFENVSSEDHDLMYATLDCRKWAPRSNLWKYAYFIEGMKDSLPTSFYNYFMFFWAKMFKKKILIQESYYKKLEVNKSTEKLVHFLTKFDDDKYCLEMPYSFMMGIFNYLSSLFHASSQVFFDKYISSPRGIYFNLIAHSDDSGGVIYGKSYDEMVDMFSIYEKFQKLCNHLMSKKKSCLSKVGFEIVSIMYQHKRLIPMTHKFITNVSIDPTGDGWGSDIKSTVGKVVDAFHNGCSYLTCYSLMLTYQEMMRKAYHLIRNSKRSYIPLEFGGVFDLHPIHMILLGSMSQECMLDLVESKRARDIRINFYKLITGGYVIGKGSRLNIISSYFKRHPNQLQLEEDKYEILNKLSLLTDRTTLTDAIKYYNDINTRKFRFSLLNIDVSKLLISTLFYKQNIMKFDNQKYGSFKKISDNYFGLISIGLHCPSQYVEYSNNINYIRAAESIPIDFNKIDHYSEKSCKPTHYQTFMNLGLEIRYEDIQNLLLVNSKQPFPNFVKNKTKYIEMTKWVSKHIAGDDLDDKLSQLQVLERADVEKLRSAYLFMPSGVNIDTVERFWTYSLLYCSRRYLISSQKPQMYTLEKFEFWHSSYESLKHFYLLIKLFVESKSKSTDLSNRIINNYDNCELCVDKESLKNTILEIKSLNELGEFETSNINIPFAIYKRAQYKGRNVWFGSSDFILYTVFGNVEHKIKDGDIYTWWSVFNESALDQLWYLYKIFCQSRGIDMARITYLPTGFKNIKLGFSHSEIPYIPNSSSKTMCLENSLVELSDYRQLSVKMIDKNLNFRGDIIDLNIYQVYDLNEGFFNSHKLESIRDLILTKEVDIDKNILLNHFLSSYCYNCLYLDDYHKSTNLLTEKYKHDLLLASPGSFTRALCLASLKGIVDYRSSLNINEKSPDFLEFKTIRDIPVIDLVSYSCFSRMTFEDFLAMQKIMRDDSINQQDIERLNSMVDRIGLASTATMLVQFKNIFNELKPNLINKISLEVRKEIIKDLIDALHEVMGNQTTTDIYSYRGSKKDFWKAMKRVITSSNINDIITLLVSGSFKCHKESTSQFWKFRKENKYLALLNFHSKSSRNVFSILQAIILTVNKADKKFLNQYIRSKRLFITAKVTPRDELIEEEEFLDPDDFDPEILDSKIQVELPICRVIDEDGLDELIGGDVPDDREPRYFNGEEIKFLILTNDDYLAFQEYTIKNDFSSVSIYSPVRFIEFTWLGGAYNNIERLDGELFYVTKYPGKYPVQKYGYELQLAKKAVTKTFTDLIVEKSKETEEETKEDQDTNITNINEALDLQKNIELSFKNLGLPVPSSVSKILNSGKNILDILRDIVGDMGKVIQKRNRQREFKGHLPGYIGALKDYNVSGELKSIFGSNYNYIASGKAHLSQTTFNLLRSVLLSMYHSCTINHQALIIFILSILKETVISKESDNWFVDSITNVIESIKSNYNTDDDQRVISAPAPVGFNEYEYYYEYK